MPRTHRATWHTVGRTLLKWRHMLTRLRIYSEHNLSTTLRTAVVWAESILTGGYRLEQESTFWLENLLVRQSSSFGFLHGPHACQALKHPKAIAVVVGGGVAITLMMVLESSGGECRCCWWYWCWRCYWCFVLVLVV